MESNEFLSPNLLFDQLISSLSINLLRSLVPPILKYRERIIQILFQIFFSPCFYNETEICSPLGKKLSNTEDAKRMFGDARIEIGLEAFSLGEIDEVDASRPRDRGL